MKIIWMITVDMEHYPTDDEMEDVGCYVAGVCKNSEYEIDWEVEDDRNDIGSQTDHERRQAVQ